MHCCLRCFSHLWLKEYILSHSTQNGDCPYCGSRAVPIIPLGQIAPMFEPMMSLYKELNADTILDYEDPFKVGSLLLDLVQEWGVFSTRLINSSRAEALLKRLANYNWDDDSGEPLFNTVDLYTSRTSWSHETLEQVLDGVIRDLNEDANDPEISAKLGDALEEHLGALNRQVKKGAVFYRGRPGCQILGTPHAGVDIGAPPAGLASAGRANPAGVSVLYMARNEQTAAAELRVRTPEGPLSMCRVRVGEDLNVVDIVRGFPRINPFTTSEEHLGWTVEVAELLNLFGYELSQPVQLGDNPQEYRVTQKLCEAVRSAGYQGILYPSTRRQRGVNLVVFDPRLCRIGRSWLVP
jgi:RES domain-containing protein